MRFVRRLVVAVGAIGCCLLAVFCFLHGSNAAVPSAADSVDVLITNTLLYDGTGQPSRQAAIAGR